MWRLVATFVCLPLLMSTPGCSIRALAVNALADALAAGGEVYASDEDPELVREALPFALKTIETLLAERPDHDGLLLAAASGFTQYAYAFVETEAQLLAAVDFEDSRRLRDRALGLYLRARDYGLRGLELRYPGIGRRLVTAPEAAVSPLRRRDVTLLYWTAAAWGAAISVGRHRPELVADLPTVAAMMGRALVLDEGFDQGAIHEAHIALAALPVHLSGISAADAERHFDRVLELTGGRAASPYVTFAESVALPAQDRAEFVDLLGRALAVDPDSEPSLRLANRIAQRRAQALLSKVDELFLDDEETFEEDFE